MTADILVRNLHYIYPTVQRHLPSQPVLRGVNVEIPRGQFVALLGRVGAGKTTLCLTLNGLVPNATGGVFRGDVWVQGLNTKEQPVAALAPLTGMVFQDPEVQLIHTRVDDEIVFGPENLGIPPGEIAERLEWALHVTGLKDFRDRSPLLLSGGEKQRVAIAAVLAMRPQTLVLDEPTASLDPAGKATIFGVLADLTRKHNMTVVMATQETERALRYADRILVLDDGVIALDGTPEQIFRQADTMVALGLATSEMTELGRRLSAATARPYHFDTVSAAYRRLRGEVGRAGLIPATTAAAVSPAAPPQIRIEHLTYSYDAERNALQDVNLNVWSGEFVALVGRNGSGKTTLARHLNGLLRPATGTVTIDGLDTRTQRTSALARRVGYVFQNPDHQIFAATVREELAFGLRVQGAPPAAVEQQVVEALDLFGLAAYANQPPASLGYGQRRLVALASILVTQPDILILDEPTDGLDARSQDEIMRVIQGFNAGGGTTLLITHDLPLVANYARRVVALSAGRVIFDGAPSGLFGKKDVLAQAGLMPPRVWRLAERLAPPDAPISILTPEQFVTAWVERGDPAGERP